MAFLVRGLLAIVLLGAAPQAVITARVVKVADGDTITVRIPGKPPLKVRLVDIDTPEGDQPYGREARLKLVALIGDSEVRIETHGTDKYGRILGRVFVGRSDVNAELVRSGAAWVFRRYSDDPELLALEKEARAQRRGLWALPESERVPPWDWRHPDGAPVHVLDPTSTAFQCGDKTYCGEMVSCAEARFHLEECDLARLDRDGDGVPCETICAGRR